MSRKPSQYGDQPNTTVATATATTDITATAIIDTTGDSGLLYELLATAAKIYTRAMNIKSITM